MSLSNIIRLVALPILALTLITSARANLLENVLEIPLINYRNESTIATSYNATTDVFSLTTGQLFYFDGSGSGSPIFITNGQLNLVIKVDQNGMLVLTGAAHDLLINGTVTINGTTYTGTALSPLLTGKVNAFGFSNGGSTDFFDFQLDNIGGQLAVLYSSGLGIVLDSKISSFNGSFLFNFNGQAKGDVGGVELPPELASLGDFVWNDLNMNGIQDLNEPGIEDVQVNLRDPGDNGTCESTDFLLETDYTDADGLYGFTDLNAGNYCVEFIAPNGYVYSPQNVGNDASDSDADPLTGLTTTIILAPGDNDLTWDAGLFVEVVNASLGDFVWEDLNMDGIQDLGEPGVENVIVNLFTADVNGVCNTNGMPFDSTFTNTNGIYGFTDLTPGNYCLVFIPPSGFDISPQDQGINDEKDSDADPFTPFTGKTVTTTLEPGENDLSWDMGVFQPILNASLGNFVWLDLDRDGFQEANEPGIEGVVVNLRRPPGGVNNTCANGSEIDTDVTDMDGIYGFTDLDAGEYCVEFIKPAGFISSPQNTTVDTLDSDADPVSGQTSNIVLAPGDNDLTWDAGMFPRPLAKLGDRVWNDLNADGIQDCVDNGDGIIGGPGDMGAECGTGIENVRVTLRSNPDGNDNCLSGGDLETTTTDMDGFYVFNDLDPDLEYCVRFDQVSANMELNCMDIINPGIGAQFSPANQGSDATDSDADTVTGLTGNISLNSGEFNRTYDAGFYCPAKIGDSLINDLNRNGIQDPTEPGIDGQQVQLVECIGGVPGTTVIDSTTTAGGGMYMFNPLPPGEYAVIFTKPGDTEFSVSDPNVDDNINCDTNANGHSQCVTLSANEYNDRVDACVNTPPAGLGNFVFEDKDLDGIQDLSERGVNDVTVNLLLPGVDGMCNSADDVAVAGPNGTTTTAGNGLYEFTGLNPGTYCVEFDLASLPTDFCTTDGFDLGTPKFTLKNEGTDAAKDSDADPVSGKTGNIVLLANQFDPKNDAGIYCPAKIGDRVWEDTNGNGIQEVTESGVAGLEVKLFDCGPDGVIGTADDVNTGQSRFTDNTDGNYMFGAEPGVFDLAPGNYYVQFEKPFGSQFTTPGVGTDEAIDSNCNANGTTSCAAVGSRGIDLTRDCGIIPPPPPNCDLVIDKTCAINTPPPPTFDKCSGKLQEFTVKWTGGPININGLPNDTVNGNVTTGQEVTFYGPFSQNDVFVNISGSVSGQSKFHMSCSDEDFNSPDDCGKLAGNAKSTTGFINEWKLEGFIDNDNTVLNCTSDSASDFPTQDSCSFTPQYASCDTMDKPTSLTFKYTGAGCSASDNAQSADKAVCTGDVNGMNAVSIVAGDLSLGSTYSVSPTSVAPGGLFTMSADRFNSNSRIDISNAGGTESNTLHLSCSQPLAVGDKYGSLELVGYDGVTAETEVLYGYTVTNLGDPLTNVSIVDSHLGTIADMLTFDMNQTRQFTQLGNVSATTTNVATVSGLLANSDQCQVSDELTVEVVEPVTPVSCSDIKPLTTMTMIWDGASGVDIETEVGQLFTGVQNGNKITFNVNPDNNDTYLFISGAETGTSSFHKSCSDNEMAGTEHCGTYQGNGKNNDQSINSFLFEGMAGENGSFSCNGVYDVEVIPTNGGGTGGGPTDAITAGSVLDLSDDKIKWKLFNNSDTNLFVTDITVVWPGQHDFIEKIKLEGDFAKGDALEAMSSPTTLGVSDFVDDMNKRKLKKDDDKWLEIEFKEQYKTNHASDYYISITFDNGQTLTIGNP